MHKLCVTCIPLSLRKDVDVVMDVEVFNEQEENDRHNQLIMLIYTMKFANIRKGSKHEKW